MLLRGYVANIGNCAKSFLQKNKAKQYDNKSFAYIVKLNDDKIKIGSTNQLYHKINTYNNMYKKVDVLSVTGFPSDPTNQIKYNNIYARRLVKINNNSYYHNAADETTILKSVKDLREGKFKILALDML
tara:strand:- start:1344 stop:1730 length:387 start_codon:yes stop_codon:yes gene_type:complete